MQPATTVWPDCAKRWQIALPMPPMPPETKAMRGTTGRVRSRHASSCDASITSGSCFIVFPLYRSTLAFNSEGDPHPAPDAKRGKASPRVALLHFVEKGDQHARARGADRMTERDGAAVHVHLLRVPAHLAVDRDRLRGEGFVDLHEIEILRFPAGARERALRGGHRSHPHVFRIDARRGEGLDACQRLQTQLFGLS